jgi:hypothetical protein
MIILTDPSGLILETAGVSGEDGFFLSVERFIPTV